MNEVKIVKVRKPHLCDACGDKIERGEKAFVISVLLTSYQRFPDVYYFHYKDTVTPEKIKGMSWNEIRDEICYQRYQKKEGLERVR